MRCATRPTLLIPHEHVCNSCSLKNRLAFGSPNASVHYKFKIDEYKCKKKITTQFTNLYHQQIEKLPVQLRKKDYS